MADGRERPKDVGGRTISHEETGEIYDDKAINFGRRFCGRQRRGTLNQFRTKHTHSIDLAEVADGQERAIVARFVDGGPVGLWAL